MKEVLTDIGVNISLNHRNAFSEVEEQVLDLIKVIGKSFVDECEYIDVQERKYR